MEFEPLERARPRALRRAQGDRHGLEDVAGEGPAGEEESSHGAGADERIVVVEEVLGG